MACCTCALSRESGGTESESSRPHRRRGGRSLGALKQVCSLAPRPAGTAQRALGSTAFLQLQRRALLPSRRSHHAPRPFRANITGGSAVLARGSCPQLVTCKKQNLLPSGETPRASSRQRPAPVWRPEVWYGKPVLSTLRSMFRNFTLEPRYPHCMQPSMGGISRVFFKVQFLKTVQVSRFVPGRDRKPGSLGRVGQAQKPATTFSGKYPC